MGFLLKIVEGPNKGAEIALVDGVAVTLGKGDDCDIVLADPTLPETPLTIEASVDGVTIGGEALAPLAVKTLGATSLAVGPADAPWGELAWPKAEEPSDTQDAEKQNADDSKGGAKSPLPSSDEASASAPPESSAPVREKKSRLGCIIAAAILLLLLLLAAIAWFARSSGETSGSGGTSEAGETALPAIAERYGLTLAETNGIAVLSGNLATRGERLAATAEAYAADPGIALDISDDESFRMAAENALFTLTENALKVVAATNRHLRIAGSAASPSVLGQTLKALAADLPWMRDADVSGVALVTGNAEAPAEQSRRKTSKSSAGAATMSLPVCGILTVPYPCLVMRDGRRIMEGAMLGDSTILKIESESVTLTNSMGRIAWKP